MFLAAVFFSFAALFYWIGSSFLQAEAGFFSAAAALGFCWAALSEAVTGAAYLSASLFRINPGWSFKRLDGTLLMTPRFFTWPYLFFEYLAWRRYRNKTEEPLFEQASLALFLGARVSGEDVVRIKQAGIGAVLDMIAEFAPPRELRNHGGIVYMSIPVLDGTAPSMKDLEHGVRFIREAFGAGRKVLVHCTFGHGRSATVVAAAMIAEGKASDPGEAIRKLKRLERRIYLSREQKRILRRFSTKYDSRESCSRQN